MPSHNIRDVYINNIIIGHSKFCTMPRKIIETAIPHQSDNLVLSYCGDECRGLAVKVEAHESMETNCPICLISFVSGTRIMWACILS